ncbi:hypothetical protein NDU88_000824 [Pleurodeles waltl]|uniref:Integrase catalytic domain-containing protein n=1 Tax=Pleurodeles waltl TaxID=8319 RepID=A0AAV7TG37_PLEWA|nr:hypothetical protein NDU88_000824 [Pleurodeles waltl]
MLHNPALRRQVPFLQEDENGDGRVAVVEPVDSDKEEAEKEDVDSTTTIIQHAAVCTANGLLRLNDRSGDSWVMMQWLYFCWRTVYRPEASGLVEQKNGTLKSRIAKMCAAMNLKWPDALPLVLMSIRNTPDRKTGLSPHKILMGRAMRLAAVPANAIINITDHMVFDYCKGLADVVRSFSQQVEATTLPPIYDPGHNLKAGDWVVVQKYVHKTCLETR